MPKEIRHVQFDQQDLRAALSAYLRQASWTNPVTGIGAIDLADDSVGPVAMVVTHTPQGMREVVVPSEDLHSALLMFCKHMRIPLPIRSVKTLQRSGETLVLDISRTTGRSRQDALPPPPRRRLALQRPQPSVLDPPSTRSE